MATANGYRAMPSAVTAEPIIEPIIAGFAGIVLAGGASSRMGEDKARLKLNGGDLLSHAVLRLEEAGARPVIVSGERPEYDCVPDEEPGRGPLGGLYSVIRSRPGLGGRLLLVTAVDTPGLSSHALERLLDAARHNGRGVVFKDHPLPLAVFANAALERTLNHLLNRPGKASVGRLAEALDCGRLAADGIDLSNINTPDDWARFRNTV